MWNRSGCSRCSLQVSSYGIPESVGGSSVDHGLCEFNVCCQPGDWFSCENPCHLSQRQFHIESPTWSIHPRIEQFLEVIDCFSYNSSTIWGGCLYTQPPKPRRRKWDKYEWSWNLSLALGKSPWFPRRLVFAVFACSLLTCPDTSLGHGAISSGGLSQGQSSRCGARSNWGGDCRCGRREHAVGACNSTWTCRCIVSQFGQVSMLQASWMEWWLDGGRRMGSGGDRRLCSDVEAWGVEARKVGNEWSHDLTWRTDHALVLRFVLCDKIVEEVPSPPCIVVKCGSIPSQALVLDQMLVVSNCEVRPLWTRANAEAPEAWCCPTLGSRELVCNLVDHGKRKRGPLLLVQRGCVGRCWYFLSGEIERGSNLPWFDRQANDMMRWTAGLKQCMRTAIVVGQNNHNVNPLDKVCCWKSMTASRLTRRCNHVRMVPGLPYNGCQDGRGHARSGYRIDSGVLIVSVIVGQGQPFVWWRTMQRTPKLSSISWRRFRCSRRAWTKGSRSTFSVRSWRSGKLRRGIAPERAFASPMRWERKQMVQVLWPRSRGSVLAGQEWASWMAWH